MPLAVDTTPFTLIDDPVWVFDLDHYRIVWGNAAAVELWKAESLEDLRKRDLSDSSDVAKAKLGEFADGFARGKSFETNWTLYPHNEPVEIRFRCRGIDATDGRIMMLVHVIGLEGRDSRVSGLPDLSDELHEAREQLANAEARYRTFAEAGSDWLWETDKNHQFVYYSPRLVKHFGYPLDGILGQTRIELAQQIGADPDTPETREKWAAHEVDLTNHRPFRDFRYAFRKGTGTTGYATISGDPIFDPDGTFQGYRGTGREITQRVEAEMRIREMERERDVALTANAVSSQLLATMSHELRTPLNAVLGFSEIMSREILGPVGNETYRDYATGIYDSARHLLDVVDDLLSLSRVDIGERALEIERFHAEDLFDDVTRMMQPLVKERDLMLRIDSDKAGIEIEADMRTLRQVLLNLVSNAIKFSKAGGTITIGCLCNKDKGLMIFVRDEGYGIAPEELPRVFEPFRTADPHVARDTGGTGLGLWICKRIVEAHDGDIEIESTVGQGTTVTVHLPAGTCVAGSEETRQLAG